MVKPNDPFCFSLSYGVKIFHLTSFYLDDDDGDDAIMLLSTSFSRLFLVYMYVVC